MAIYSEPISDERLIGRLDDVKSVVIAGCPGCANVSLAHLRDLPLFEISSGGLKPTPMLREISRLRGILGGKGIQIKKVLFVDQLQALKAMDLRYLAPCLMGSSTREKFARDCKGADAVVTLCCVGGHYNVVQALRESPVKAVRGMKSVGGISNPIKIDLLRGKIELERERVKVFKWIKTDT